MLVSTGAAPAATLEAPAELNGGNALASFLRRVLPQEGSGVFIVSEKPAGGKWVDHACDSIAAVAQRAIAFDAAGSDAYFALGAFKRDQSRVSRRQDRVVALRSLWLDLDVGPSKPYKTQDEASGALATFCTAIGLPAPLTVSSGSGGLHAYFPLAGSVARDEWQRAADMLKSLCVAHALAADAACTSDAARVLRPIQTRNFKDRANAHPVTLRAWGEVTPFTEIESALRKACEQCGAALTSSRAHSLRAASSSGLNTAFMVPETFPPSHAHKIADQCAQIRMFRAGTHQLEPVWHASLALLRHTVESEEIAHKWSALDPRYRQEETVGKLARLKEDYIGPTTCSRFASLNPAGCAGCPHSGLITSPIELGHRRAATLAAVTAPPAAVQSVPATPPAPPPGSTTTVSGQGFGATVLTTGPLFDIAEASASRFLAVPPKPRIWLLKDYLPAGVVGSVIAPGGTGKSQLILQLATSVAAGVPFCDTWDTGAPGEVLALLAEDDDEEVHRRLSHITRRLTEAHKKQDVRAAIGRNLYVRSVVAESNLLTSVGSNREMHDTGYAARIAETVRGLKHLKLLVLDPASRFRGGDENSAEDVTRFIEALERIRKATGATVIIVHHANKASMQGGEQTQAASRGSSAFSDGIRWQMNLAGLSEDEAKGFGVPAADRRQYLSVTMTKNNYAPPQPTIYLKRTEGGVLVRAALDDAKKGEKIMLRVVAKLASVGPISADKFEREYGGVASLLGVSDRALRRAVNQAIEAGYLSRPDSGRERPLTVTELGQAVVTTLTAADKKNGPTPGSPAIPGKASAG